MPAKENQPAVFKEYPAPSFPSDEARAAYRKARGIIKKAWDRMQVGEEVSGLANALANKGLTALPPEIGQLTALMAPGIPVCPQLEVAA